MTSMSCLCLWDTERRNKTEDQNAGAHAYAYICIRSITPFYSFSFLILDNILQLTLDICVFK